MARRFAGWLLVPLLAAAVLAVTAEDVRLVMAAKNRDAAAVRALLKQGLNVNQRYADGTSALHWAAYWGDPEMADLLIRAGADVQAADDLGVMPLALAAQHGDAAIVQKLLAASANPNVVLRSGETPLMLAARAGNVGAVKALLDRDATVNAKEKSRGQTALMWAAAEKHTAAARLLLQFGADVNARSDGKYTPLLFSARANDVETAKVLLAGGARIEDADSDGYSPLVVATLMGNTAIAKFLMENGADVNSSGGGFTPLHWAAGFWDLGFSGPYGVKAEDSEWSAVSGLRGQAKFDFAKYLVDHGAGVNARLTKGPRRGGLGAGGTIGLSLAGATPLLLAANDANVPIMRMLLEHGADPKVVLRNGTTALMLAVGITRGLGASWVTEEEAMAAAKLAIELGSDVNAANSAGDTAMHACAYSGYNTIIPFLMEKGASLNPKNKNGHTPYLIANGQGPRVAGDNPHQPTTAALLRKLGADLTGHCDWPCLQAKDGEKPVGGGDYERPGR